MPKAPDDTHQALPPVDTDDAEVELLCWQPEDGEGEGEDFDDELPADEAAFDARFPDEVVDEDGDDDEVTQAGAPGPVDVTPDEYELRRRAALPQPDRARSAPDLPKVKASAFKRLLK